MLTHELNNYTMSEAIKYYPQLKSSFSVRSIPYDQKSVATALTLSFFALVFGPRRCLLEQDAAIRGDELLLAHV